MKKQGFNINKWQEAETKKRKIRKECVIFFAKHPLTWVILMKIFAYGGEALSLAW